MLFDVINRKYNKTPGQRQHLINSANMTAKQLEHIIREAESEKMLLYSRRGFGKEATWK
jgi:hypothetical protein